MKFPTIGFNNFDWFKAVAFINEHGKNIKYAEAALKLSNGTRENIKRIYDGGKPVGKEAGVHIYLGAVVDIPTLYLYMKNGDVLTFKCSTTRGNPKLYWPKEALNKLVPIEKA